MEQHVRLLEYFLSIRVSGLVPNVILNPRVNPCVFLLEIIVFLDGHEIY